FLSAFTAHKLGELEAARVLASQMLDLSRDLPYEQGLAWHTLGCVAASRHDYRAASSMLARARLIHESMEAARRVAITTVVQGFVSSDEGEHAEAVRSFEAALQTFETLRDRINVGKVSI